MADSPEKQEDQPGDNPDAVKSQTEATNPPDGAAADETPKTSGQEDAQPAKEETTKPNAQDIPLDELLQREDVKRTLQSVSDRARSAERKEFEAEQKQREAAAREQSDREEERKLREQEDYDAIGRRHVAKQEAEEQMYDSLQKAGNIIGSAMLDRYIADLGEETVAKIQREVKDRGGHIVDLQDELAKERQRRAVDSTTKDVSEKVRAELKEDMEALRAELGVKKRSEAAAEGEAAVEEVSGGQPQPQTEAEDTYVEASIKYGRGEMTREEFLPYLEAHEKEQGRKIRR